MPYSQIKCGPPFQRKVKAKHGCFLEMSTETYPIKAVSVSWRHIFFCVFGKFLKYAPEITEETFSAAQNSVTKTYMFLLILKYWLK